MLFSQFEISYYLISRSARIKIKNLTGEMKELLAEGIQHLMNYDLEYTAWPARKLLNQSDHYHRQSCSSIFKS